MNENYTYVIKYYAKKLENGNLKELVERKEVPATAITGYCSKGEALNAYNQINDGTFIIYGDNKYYCVGKILMRLDTPIKKERDKSIPDNLAGEVIEQSFPSYGEMKGTQVSKTCYFIDYLKCIPNKLEDERFLRWEVYYQKSQVNKYVINYNTINFTWYLDSDFLAQDQEALMPDVICERVINYVYLIANIMRPLHNRLYEYKYRDSIEDKTEKYETTYAARAAAAGVSLSLYNKRRKEFGTDDLTPEQLQKRPKGRPKQNKEPESKPE